MEFADGTIFFEPFLVIMRIHTVIHTVTTTLTYSLLLHELKPHSISFKVN